MPDPSPLLAVQHPIFAIAGAAAVVIVAWGLVKRLIMLTIIFGIVAVVAWVIFFSA